MIFQCKYVRARHVGQSKVNHQSTENRDGRQNLLPWGNNGPKNKFCKFFRRFHGDSPKFVSLLQACVGMPHSIYRDLPPTLLRLRLYRWNGPLKFLSVAERPCFVTRQDPAYGWCSSHLSCKNGGWGRERDTCLGSCFWRAWRNLCCVSRGRSRKASLLGLFDVAARTVVQPRTLRPCYSFPLFTFADYLNRERQPRYTIERYNCVLVSPCITTTTDVKHTYCPSPSL